MNNKSNLFKTAQNMMNDMFQPEAAIYEKHGCQLNFRFKTSKKGDPYLLVSVQLANDSKSTAVRTGRIKIFTFNAKPFFNTLYQNDKSSKMIRKVKQCLQKDLRRLTKNSIDKYFKTRYIGIIFHPIQFYKYLSVYKAYYATLASALEIIYTIAVIIVIMMTAIVEIRIMNHIDDALGI